MKKNDIYNGVITNVKPEWAAKHTLYRRTGIPRYTVHAMLNGTNTGFYAIVDALDGLGYEFEIKRKGERTT